MKKRLLFFTLLVAALASGYARERISLAGRYETHLGEISLPGSVDQSRLSVRNQDTLTTTHLTQLHPFAGVITYSRVVEIPRSFEGKRLRIVMERTKPSTLWINGDSIGSNNMILTPQVYEIAAGKLKTGKNRIEIRIDNSATSVPKGVQGSHAWVQHTQTNWNGVIGDFYVEALEDNYIESLVVYPSIANRNAVVKVKVHSKKGGKTTIKLGGELFNSNKKGEIVAQRQLITLQKGLNEYSFTVAMDHSAELWDEFTPSLYRLNVELTSGKATDSQTTTFGLRNFKANGRHFSINGKNVMLRGKHDACVFPLTGFPPTTVEEWIKVMKISKDYGMNHYRFHSWTPPRAAFEAADILGIYLQPELPYWGGLSEKNPELITFLTKEGDAIFREYGNNPSFTMFALGNELSGDDKIMRSLVDRYRAADPRHIYAFGSNNYLGNKGWFEGEDFFVTCRTSRDTDSVYTNHTRASFAFVDAYKGGYINGFYPSTNRNYQNAIEQCPLPIISHESGQFQIYPNYDEIKKYTGVLYPYNLEVFRRRLQENGLSDQAYDFHQASGRLAAICYKADIEMCMRTPEMGGFQILDLQDFPGQGSALVGMIDAFMEDKGFLSAEQFSRFNSQIVPLAVMGKYCWSNDELFNAKIQLANYSAGDLQNVPSGWEITDGRKVIASQKFITYAKQGGLSTIGEIKAPLASITKATKLCLTIKVGEKHSNSYDLWVYPSEVVVDTTNIVVCSTLSDDVLTKLSDGAKVLFIPQHNDIEKQSIGGLFTPDYWNFAMFKGISERNKREISPGTLSVLTDEKHPIFVDFPTEMHSNWQWWAICRNSRPFILNNTPKEYRPIVQMVDNVERNYKLGTIFEFRVGNGKLLICTTDLNAISNYPEGRQFYYSIVNYMNSIEFNPQFALTTEQLTELITAKIEGKKIIEVTNISDYK